MTNQEKSEKYATMCYMYGLTAILVILQNSAYDWDECDIILDALNGMEYHGIKFPERYSPDADKSITELLRLIIGRDGIEVINYLEKHIQVIKDYVK